MTKGKDEMMQGNKRLKSDKNKLKPKPSFLYLWPWQDATVAS